MTFINVLCSICFPINPAHYTFTRQSKRAMRFENKILNQSWLERRPVYDNGQSNALLSPRSNLNTITVQLLYPRTNRDSL